MSLRLPAWLAKWLGRRENAGHSPSPTRGEKTPGGPALPDNPYRRFYTPQRRLEDLAPRPPEPKK